ncbi:MAG: signal peptidase I [Chloroflexota bacterium]
MELKPEDYQSENLFDFEPTVEDHPVDGLPVEGLPDEETTDRKPGLLRFFYDVFETLLLAAILFIGINAVSARVRVDGSSMEPSFHHGEFVVVNRLAYKLGTYNIGDVVVFHYPRDPDQEYIKRIIGVAGDNIQISNGLVYLNAQLLNEPYIAAPPRYNGSWNIPEGHVFVLGDNRNNSSDSHNWGPLQKENIIGRAIFIYWPLDEFGGIKSITALTQ